MSRSIPQPYPAGASPRLGLGPKLAYLLMLLGLVLLGVTGIGTFALGRAPMSGWILMLHVGASPTFSIGLALVALTWNAHRPRPRGAQGFLFLFLLLSGLVVILSGVVPMTPVLGTEGQHFLYLVHRYGAMVTAGAALLHLLSLWGKR